ncbi:MAG: hypothetical protein IPN16_20895 [Gemmatimonadetes bacterium]|nr:hypothetical protein [Gemmatimonadota bacterium]
MRLLGQAVHRLRHTIEEERLRLVLAAVTVSPGDELLGLRHRKRGEEIREDRLERTAKPNIEEVRQIGIPNVVVIGGSVETSFPTVVSCNAASG